MHKSMQDISRSISPKSVVFAGSKPLGLSPLCSIGPNSQWSVTQLDWTTHFLTHVDPPSHGVLGGATLDDIPLSRFTGPAIVAEASGDCVELKDVPANISGMNVLFKTRNSDIATDAPFAPNYVYISAEAADDLVQKKVNLVGIDYLSVDRFGDQTVPAHRALLGNNILILEGLDLSQVTPGRYTLFAFPLRIANGDGSPVRAIIIPE
jgi:arylformamidase